MWKAFRYLLAAGALAPLGLLTFGAYQAVYRPAVIPAGPLPFVGPPPMPKAPPGKVRRLQTPADAVGLALADLLTLREDQRCYSRYLWVQDGAKESMRSASLTLNYLSRGSVLQRPLPVAGGHLLRLDLRQYAPRTADLAEWCKLWEEFAFDPCFAQLVTRDAVEFAGGKAQRDVTRYNAPHLDAAALFRLQAFTGSQAPVVEHRYFKARALSTIKDRGVFRDVFGGLYYDLRGVKKARAVLGADTKATDLDVFFEALGIGNVKAGLTADVLFDRLRSDQRLAVFRSGVTGKPREVSSFHVPADKEGSAWGAITGDVKDSNIDIGDRPFANLLTPRRDAREAIFPAATSLDVFALFNGAGELQDEVPPDIAPDTTIPGAHPKRLQPAIGCIRCHGPFDGWQPLVNDVQRLLNGKLDLLTDFAGLRQKRGDNFDVLDRLAGLYAGDFSKNLRRARDDVAETTLRATGPWEGSADQTDAARRAAARLSEEYAEFVYELCTPRTALREMGVDVPEKHAQAALLDLLPPDGRADLGGFIPEDPRIAGLRAGLGIPRADFSLAYSYMMERAKQRLAWIEANGGGWAAWATKFSEN